MASIEREKTKPGLSLMVAFGRPPLRRRPGTKPAQKPFEEEPEDFGDTESVSDSLCAEVAKRAGVEEDVARSVIDEFMGVLQERL